MVYYTNIIFKNRKIEFNINDNKNHKTIALEDINEGEIILIEHLVSNNNSNKIINYVYFNEELFNNLYPRENIYTYEDRVNEKKDIIKKLAIEKVQKNIFKICLSNKKPEQIIYYVMGVYISKFNHNINNNTFMNISNITKNNKQLTYVVVTANTNIKKNSEITINYGKNYFNEIDGIDIPESYPINNITLNILNKYIDKEIFNKIYYNLYLAEHKKIYLYDNDNIFKCN